MDTRILGCANSDANVEHTYSCEISELKCCTMFEGKNIHYSDVDHKPLCSCSIKVCRQRRLNGYAFCLRHILEDPSAPFKQCLHQAKHRQCSNPIPQAAPAQFCNCHSNILNGKSTKRLPSPLHSVQNGFSSSPKDDPYAFPDADPLPAPPQAKTSPPITYHNNPSSRPINTISIAKLYPELAEKLERVRTKSSEQKNAKTPVKNAHSRTMSRLQTKIAQNKIKDKLKNRTYSNVPAQPSTPLTPVTVVTGSCSPNPACVADGKPQTVPMETKDHSPHVPVTTLLSSTPTPVMSARPTTSKVTPVVKTEEEVKGEVTFVKLKRPRDVLSETEAKRRLKRRTAVRTYAFYASEKVHNADLLPMGIDSSDESEVDDLIPWQRNWLLSSSDEESGDEEMDEELSSNIRKTKLALHKAKLRRQFSQLCHMHSRNQAKRSHIQGGLRALVASARSSPVCCVRAIAATTSDPSTEEDSIRKSTAEKPRPCLHRNQGNDSACNALALPYTNHCAQHVMYNVDQQVYEFCTAKFSDNTQCCVPVLDPHHELALCPEHAAKADNYEKNHEPRPKKPRKKTKPSALTRPPKKGKKKKNQRRKIPEEEALPPHDPVTSQAPPTSLPAANQRSQFESAPPTYANQPAMPNDMGFLNGVIDKELDLPLDTQATNFLDEHDLHEVLNKLPDEAFDLLAGCADDKADNPQSTLESAALENAWAAAMSQDMNKEHRSLSNDLSDPSVTSHEDDLTKQIAAQVSLLNPLSPSGSATTDDPDQSNDFMNDLASSLSATDLKNISQVLSGFVDVDVLAGKQTDIPPQIYTQVNGLKSGFVQPAAGFGSQSSAGTSQSTLQ
ncbi:hypothetical protein CAPTEDRAFT_196622 [Capitella teleta]|uniref:KANL2-like probable zinc-finger domain-containing protein n=1 Tax=Capitella teleta TaxID=283909 RepID=R7U824_CAPTE|nr:hypothetical protein CAPTEDRAFT_196622 [Capitella teleta]|eukprot:ELU02134.1 hypothetical protein CAPTEDRAFT_196622 [Capitella teleta]